MTQHPRRPCRRSIAAQNGITGLETAIILIAFVVVASIFAFTVLSAGLFAAMKGQEATTAGVDQVTSAIELVGDIKADGAPATTLTTVNGAGGWTTSVNVTAATEASDYKEGTAGLTLTVASAFTTGLIAYENLSSTVDLSGHFAAGLWIKANTLLSAGVLKLVLDDTPGCGSPEESLSIAALTADTWVDPHMNVTDAAALTAVACVGITAASDPGAITLYVDRIQGPPEVQALYIAMNNTIPTRGITFVTTVDADSDGLLSDEASPTHYMIVSYSNNELLVRDLAWTVSELGLGDGDMTLEAGETFLLHIDLRAVDPIPTSRSLMSLQIAAHDDASIVIERIAPTNISTSMVLR